VLFKKYPTKIVIISLVLIAATSVWAAEETQKEVSPSTNDFIINTLVPLESIYFQPGIGIDRKSGMPFDHIRVRLKQGILGEVGNYTAASKLSLSIPYLLGVIQEKPVFQHARITPEQAKILLERALRTHLRYIETERHTYTERHTH